MISYLDIQMQNTSKLLALSTSNLEISLNTKNTPTKKTPHILFIRFQIENLFRLWKSHKKILKIPRYAFKINVPNLRHYDSSKIQDKVIFFYQRKHIIDDMLFFEFEFWGWVNKHFIACKFWDRSYPGENLLLRLCPFRKVAILT